MSRDKTPHGAEENLQALKTEADYFTIEDVAKKIGKSTRTVHSYVDLGLLSCHQAGKNHPLRFTQDQLDAYFAKMERRRKK